MPADRYEGRPIRSSDRRAARSQPIRRAYSKPRPQGYLLSLVQSLVAFSWLTVNTRDEGPLLLPRGIKT